MTDSTPTVIRVAAAVIVDDFGRILLVRKRGTAAFMQPGGKIRPGETPVEALHREVTEELDVGIVAESVRFLGRHVAPAANEPDHTVEAELFLVRPIGTPQASAEIDELLWVDPAAPGDIELAPLTRNAVLTLVCE
ncbi:NUDIX hydrolase [Mycolicibacterium arenosum]|uniref:NUDIX domain-containing protein n=1 Tax=Mycolicibacterium arenosum TaxID=2952157 RepID=A0ABT1MAM3_9MYCO|nr:NUDIX domain-containing protein [Mycolicibacterium sp. CAU 1645]MCP9276214.1 NUDIX domain-containing protein [Mycolicibacterium sp. CAU 1645]